MSLSFCLSSGDDKYEVSWGAGDDGGGGGSGGYIEGDDDVGGEELCSCS